MQVLSVVMEGLTMALSKIGAGTPEGQAIAKAIVDIGKHIPPGATSPQGTSNSLKAMALKHAQMQPHIAAQGGAAPPPGAAPPGGAPPSQPPMAA